MKKLLLVIVLFLFVTANVHCDNGANTKISDEITDEKWTEKVLMAFQGHCYNTEANYDTLNAIAKVSKFKELDKDTTKALMGPKSSDGRGFVLEVDKKRERLLLLGFSKPNVCAISSNNHKSNKEIRKKLEEIFQLKKLNNFQDGFQTMNVYVTPAENGMIYVTETILDNREMMTIAFLPTSTLNALSQN